MHLNIISTGQPIYWPSDKSRILDFIDFAITKGISSRYTKCKSTFDLSSDHTSVLITVNTQIMRVGTSCTLQTTQQRTNWQQFCELITANLSTKMPLNNKSDLDKAVRFNNRVQ